MMTPLYRIFSTTSTTIHTYTHSSRLHHHSRDLLPFRSHLPLIILHGFLAQPLLHLPLLLLLPPPHRPLDPFVQPPHGGVPQHALRLARIEIPRHAAILHHTPSHTRLLRPRREHPHDPLQQARDRQPERLIDGPDPRGARPGNGIPGRGPHGAGEVPEIDRLRVGDEEGLPVGALVVQRHRARGAEFAGCGQQGDGGEDVGVGGVADVGEVEEVGVGAELEGGLALGEGFHHAGDELEVAFAEDAGGADGGGEEVRGGRVAVVGQDEGFGEGFGFGVVFWLEGGGEDGVGFVGVAEGGDGVVDDGGGGGVDEGLDGGGFGGAGEEVGGAGDVDGVEEGAGFALVELCVAGGEGGGGGVDDDGGFDGGEDGAEGVERCNVTFMVGDVGVAIGGGAEVEDGDVAAVGVEQLADDVGAQEAAAADNEDGA